MSTTAPALSVVVPSFNVEDYLQECIESLLNQPVDCEVIIVDDGSTDSTLAIARAFEARYPCVRVSPEMHRGLSASRNRGIELARGAFLAFCDADDRVTAGGYAPLLRSLQETGSDFASGDVRRFDSSGIWPHPRYKDLFATSRRATHISRDHGLVLDRMAWNKVFRRGFWDSNGLAFELPQYEDAPVMIRAHALSKAVDVVSEVVYHWRVRDTGPQSITQRLHEPDNVLARMTMAFETMRVIQALVPELVDDFAYDIVHGDMRVLADAVRMQTDEVIAPAVARAGEFLALVPRSTLAALPEGDRCLALNVSALDTDSIRRTDYGDVWDPARHTS